MILTFFLLPFFIHAEADLLKDKRRIEKWGDQFSREANNVWEKYSGLMHFKHLVNEASYETKSIQGCELLKNISIDIDKNLQDVIRSLLLNKLMLESEYRLQKNTSSKIVDCCSSDVIKRYDARFGINVNRSKSCALSPSKDQFLTSAQEKNYKKNILSTKALTWQYFGSSQGEYHEYPASSRKCHKTKKFDPRLR